MYRQTLSALGTVARPPEFPGRLRVRRERFRGHLERVREPEYELYALQES